MADASQALSKRKCFVARREALLLHEEREKLVRHIEDLQVLDAQTMVNEAFPPYRKLPF